MSIYPMTYTDKDNKQMIHMYRNTLILSRDADARSKMRCNAMQCKSLICLCSPPHLQNNAY